jgi:hypothetical protein
MPCCLTPTTSITTLGPINPLALSMPPDRPANLTTLPRELLDQILSHLTSSADLVCLALTHPLFLSIYRSTRASHIERTGDCVRARLDRDVPVLYYCARCNCANIPCLSHVLDDVTISGSPMVMRRESKARDVFMGFLDVGERKGMAA